MISRGVFLYNFKYFGISDGTDTAIENGYVAEPEIIIEQKIPLIQDGQTVDTQKFDISTNRFVMTDDMLNLDFHFEFENS